MNSFSTPNHDSSNNSVDECGELQLRCEEEEEDILILCRWVLIELKVLYFEFTENKLFCRRGGLGLAGVTQFILKRKSPKALKP